MYDLYVRYIDVLHSRRISVLTGIEEIKEAGRCVTGMLMEWRY